MHNTHGLSHPYSFILFIDFFLLRSSEKAIEHKEMAEQELLMKGPGTFPMERLLAIFQCITSVADYSLEEEDQGTNGTGVDFGDSGLMSDVLLQLSSLCNANFISKGGSCPLEGSTRYRSTVSEDMALKVIFRMWLTKVQSNSQVLIPSFIYFSFVSCLK